MSRPSGYPIIEEAAASVMVAVTEVDKRGRLNILPRWRKRVSWIGYAENDIEALMIFSDPGLVSIQCWQPDGPRIEERANELSSAGDADALEALRLIQDRFQRLTIPGRERPSLGDNALAHLGLPIRRVQNSLVYVSVFPNKIDVMSQTYRERKLVEGHPSLDDLP